MKIKCTDMIPVLSENGKLTPEMEEHLKSCPDCAFFKEMLAHPLSDEEFQVPEKLDLSIREAAHRHMTVSKWRIWKIAVPIAASFAVCFGLVFYTIQPTPATTKQPTMQNASSWNVSDFDDNMIALSCEVAGSVSAFNFYDSI